MFWQALRRCRREPKAICLSKWVGSGRDGWLMKRPKEKESDCWWLRLGCLCGTSNGKSSVISPLPDLGVLQYEAQIARMLSIRNYMACKQRGLSHYSWFTGSSCGVTRLSNGGNIKNVRRCMTSNDTSIRLLHCVLWCSRMYTRTYNRGLKAAICRYCSFVWLGSPAALFYAPILQPFALKSQSRLCSCLALVRSLFVFLSLLCSFVSALFSLLTSASMSTLRIPSELLLTAHSACHQNGFDRAVPW